MTNSGDYFQGLAVLIGAASVGVVTILTGIVGVVLQILNYNRQSRGDFSYLKL